MWKFLIRGIRDTIEKGGERAITSVVENCQGNLSLVSNNKNPEQENKSESSRDQAGNDDYGKKAAPLNLYTILEAVGLSTVLWLGTLASHPLCWRKHQHNVGCNTNKVPRPACQYKGLVHLIAGTASTQPLATRTESPSLSLGEKQAGTGQSTCALQPEDALETARLQLQATAGYIDNKLGVMCANHGWHTEALNYFEHAWRMGDVRACYNLALCHELGLGTVTNQTLAAQYYKKACVLGHATAMYNLGVYYAQGRGGLPVDPLKARQLFEDAALQGVIEAKAALALEDKKKKKPILEIGFKELMTEDAKSHSWHLTSFHASTIS